MIYHPMTSLASFSEHLKFGVVLFEYFDKIKESIWLKPAQYGIPFFLRAAKVGYWLSNDSCLVPSFHSRDVVFPHAVNCNKFR